MDAVFELASQQLQHGHLSMLAIDSLLAFMSSLEKLADIAVPQGGVVPASLRCRPGTGRLGQTSAVASSGLAHS